MDKAAIKQNDIIETTISDYGVNGEGIAKFEGIVIFVPYALKGEQVRIKIDHVKRNFAYATVIEVLESSPKRIKPDCNRFLKCGGCNLSHIDYEEQLKIKKQALINTLKKNTGQDLNVGDIVPSPKIDAYRNKVQLPFSIVNGKVALGFYRASSHKIVSITKCFLHADWLNKLIAVVLEYANKYNLTVYDEKSQKGLLRHLVARYVNRQLCIVLVVNGEKVHKIEILIEEIQKKFDNFSFYLSINKQNTNVIMGKKLIPIIDKPLKVNILGIDAEVNPLSFLQVNNEVRDMIYTEVIQKTKNSDTVIDAYSGIGIMGAVLSKNGVKKVYNIEIIAEAIENADTLSKNNKLNNITNICGDAAIELPLLINSIKESQQTTSGNLNQSISVILDPPRKGVNLAVIEALNNIDYPINLVYISCNPATLSRDLSLLTKNGNYSILSIVPYDMFPQTKHLEVVICLSRKVV